MNTTTGSEPEPFTDEERRRFIIGWNGVEAALGFPRTPLDEFHPTSLNIVMRTRPMSTWPSAIVGFHKDDPRAEQGSVDLANRNPLNFRSLNDVGRNRRAPEWLVREFLLTDAFCVVGGAEKTLKSMILTQVAIAVASGSPLFCEERFTVKERKRVLVLTGEGSVGLFYDRVEHLCKLCGVDFEELKSGGWIEVTDTIEKTNTGNFQHGLRARIEDYDPGLVIIDPAYVYVDPGGRAGDVFTMGALLAAVRDLCQGRACAVGHHFTKAGVDDLTLSSLTQAGSREVFDHWLLVTHAAQPDLERQHFRLRARLGSRRGFGWNATFDVTLGVFDLDSLTHVGEPSWLVERDAAAAKDKVDWRKVLYQDIRDRPWELTQKDLTEGDQPMKRREALQWLREHKIVSVDRVKGPNGERAADRYGPVIDVGLASDLDALLEAWERQEESQATRSDPLVDDLVDVPPNPSTNDG